MSVLGPKRMLATAVVGALILIAGASLLGGGKPGDGESITPNPAATLPASPEAAREAGSPPSRALAHEPAPDAPPDGPPPVPPADAPASRPESLLYGSLLGASGEPIRGAWWAGVSLVDRRGRRRHADAKQEGAYALHALPFGTYSATASAEGYRSEEARLDLRPEQPVLRKDFTLREAVVLKVKVVTPDGRSLDAALEERRPEGPPLSIVPVATREPPGDRFFDVGGSLNNPFGVGSFWNYGPRVLKLPPGYLGVLILACDLPVHVSLVLYHVVLQTKRIEPGADEVVFVVSPEALEANLASIRLKVVEAESGGPIAGARVALQGSSFIDGGVRTDETGAARMEARQPGRFELEVHAEGRAVLRRNILAEPGRVTDLGTVPLEREVVVQGRFLDAEGKGVAVQFGLAGVDPAGGSGHPEAHALLRSDGEGRFTVKGLGRGEYLLRTRNHDAVDDQDLDGTTWVSGSVLVDTRGGPILGLEVRLKRAALLVLRAGDGRAGRTGFRVLDERGLAVVAGRLHGSAPRPLKLPPGRYRVALTDAQGTEIAERSLTLGPEGAEIDLVR
ncbi:MAG: carboxypeptidase-like regulatory domain-containing protein [Planctomycetes bacterium]|nr:carboxypeptidase-like regulatory domain-containing protein [Planctomycetota bacterium]